MWRRRIGLLCLSCVSSSRSPNQKLAAINITTKYAGQISFSQLELMRGPDGNVLETNPGTPDGTIIKTELHESFAAFTIRYGCLDL
jgi:hypothetical protein